LLGFLLTCVLDAGKQFSRLGLLAFPLAGLRQEVGARFRIERTGALEVGNGAISRLCSQRQLGGVEIGIREIRIE
jgi:hypothetical protein